MWDTVLGTPQTFRNKNSLPQEITTVGVLPQWLDTQEISFGYKVGEKLLIFFSPTEEGTDLESPIVFEVEFLGYPIQRPVMGMFKIIQVWVPDEVTNKWINITEPELKKLGEPVSVDDRINVSDRKLMGLLSQESYIWKKVDLTGGISNNARYGCYIPVSWQDIASFVARESAIKYHGGKAMEKRIYLNIVSKESEEFWNSINKKVI